MDCSTSGLPVHHHLPEFTQTHVHWVHDANQPSHLLWSPSPPTFNLSQHQGLFKWVILHIRWPKYWSFSFSISPSNEYSGLISFRMDWVDLLGVQRTQESSPAPQFKSNNSSALSSKPEIKSMSPALEEDLLPLSHPGKPRGHLVVL